MTTEPLLGFARLFRAAMAGSDLGPLRTHLIEQATQNPGEAATLLDLSTVLQLTHSHDLALDIQAQALRIRQQYRVALSAPYDSSAISASPREPSACSASPREPSASSASPCEPSASSARPRELSAPPREPLRGFRVLALMSAGDFMANTPLECLLEDSGVTLDLLYVDTALPFPEVVPEHDVLFVAVGENERNRPLLEWLSERLRHWSRPVINRPEHLLALSREGVCARLQGVPGLLVSPVTRCRRPEVVRAAAGVGYPLLVRPVGSHAGHGLAKIDTGAELDAYLRDHTQEELYLTPFVDYSGADGLFRKFRIALIDGQPFLCHLAISAHWMIHYLNAGMSESAEKRAEEAQAMAGFENGFARRHEAALRAIHERMGLEYLVLDCGETRDGRLLLFEADHCMVVHAMDPPALFPYKAPRMRKVFDAFARMLVVRVSG